MNHYIIWCNLRDSHRDLAFVDAVRAYLDPLRRDGKIEQYSLTRRKLGFGPAELGEFCITISTRDLAQLDAAFDVVAGRAGETERLHAAVYSMVTDFRSALYRDFPDPQRSGAADSSRQGDAE